MEDCGPGWFGMENKTKIDRFFEALEDSGGKKSSKNFKMMGHIFRGFHCGCYFVSWKSIAECCICGIDIENENLVVPKNIFCKSQSLSECIVLMTSGKTTYHIGICDSEGMVYDFDEEGIGMAKWKKCFKIPLGFDVSAMRMDWDTALNIHCKQETGKKYDKRTNNCFHFVVRFLNFVRPTSVVEIDRSTFTKDYVCPVLGWHRLSKMYKKKLKGQNQNVVLVINHDAKRRILSPKAESLICDFCEDFIASGRTRICQICKDQLCFHCFETQSVIKVCQNKENHKFVLYTEVNN